MSHDPLAGARFAIAAPADLRTEADALDAATAPLHELRAKAGELAHRYIDAVLDGFILALARAVRGVPGAGARTASLVRGFADRFVTPGVKHARREQIDDFLGFLRHHVVEIAGAGPAPQVSGAPGAIASIPNGGTRPAIVFTVDEDFASALAPALAAAAGGTPADRDALHPALHAMIDECMHHFLDAPLAMLHFGLLARAAISVGRSGVTTRAHGLVDDVLERPDPAPLVRLATFLAESVVP
jgi:hypothetical protein